MNILVINEQKKTSSLKICILGKVKPFFKNLYFLIFNQARYPYHKFECETI